MYTIIEYSHNVMDIKTPDEFCNIRTRCINGKRNVFFIRYTGCDEALKKAVTRTDEKMCAEMMQGRLFYDRIGRLPMPSAADTAFYEDVYDRYTAGEPLSPKNCSSDSGFMAVFTNAFEETLKLFVSHSIHSPTIRRNFAVKLLYRADTVCGELLGKWSPQGVYKIVGENAVKIGDYLFYYMLTLLGADVWLIEPSSDADVPDDLKKLSLLVDHAPLCSEKLPPFDRSRIAAPVMPSVKASEIKPADGGRPRLKIPEHPSRKRQTADIPQPSAQRPAEVQQTSAPKLKVPPHPGRAQTPPPAGCTDTAPRYADRGTRNAPPPAYANSGSVPPPQQRREKSYEEIAALASSVVMIGVCDRTGNTRATGSGIMIGRDGFILTNYHVVEGGRRYLIRIENDERIFGTTEVIKYHYDLDLALIRIDRILSPIPVCPPNERLLRGQKVIAIGSPLGLFNSVSDGIVSGFRDIKGVEMVQFTAPISHGSSGGAVLNTRGELVGISTAGIEGGHNINLAVGHRDIYGFVRGFVT